MLQVLTEEDIKNTVRRYRSNLLPLLKELSFRTGKFKLASGKDSPYYINVKNAYRFPDIMNMISTLMMCSVDVTKHKSIAGVELGAIPIVTALSLKLNIPFLMIRKAKKEHGTSATVEGSLSGDKENVLMVEDVTTTGESVIKGIQSIIRMGGIVTTVVTVIDREDGAAEKLACMGAGIELIPIFKLSDFI